MRSDTQRWLRRRTFAACDWSPELLLRLKGDARVSVVLPALDEQETIGDVVAAVHRDLVLAGGGDGLVDELVVLDSGSVDATAQVARAAGATVVHRDCVLPALPAGPGKGEALWRSLAATTGDLLVFVDADLRSFNPGYVRGLLGPLLTEAGVSLVKAVYERPLDRPGERGPGDGQAGPQAAREQASDDEPGHAPVTGEQVSGGRVTELVARPLLNLHWPELAGIAQPLAGEYAARRSLLERIRFPTGYGVEMAILVDTLRMVGLDAIAQVDLGVRLHRHHDNVRLGLMAAEIMQVALSRLERAGRVQLSTPVNPTFSQLTRTPDGIRVHTQRVELVERPPMISIPDYVTARANRAS